MGEINQRMTRYVADHLRLPDDQASAVRQHYWQRYGATLLGLVRHHGVDPGDFLSKTHPGPELPEFVRRVQGERRRLEQLRGERWLLTNAPQHYACHVLELIGLKHMFARIITIEAMRLCGRLCPKPSALIMRHVIKCSGRAPSQIIFVDDHSENLRTAHRIGIQTARIWASPTASARARHSGRPLSIRRPSYVQLQVNSLALLVRHQHRLSRKQNSRDKSNHGCLRNDS